jgi:hypothetical protein
MKSMEKREARRPRETTGPGLISTHRSAFSWRPFMKAALCAGAILICVMLVRATQVSELNGYVKYADQSPAQDVVLTMGNYSVATDKNGYYRITFLSPGVRTISITPPQKATRSRQVRIGTTPTRYDVLIDW